MRRAKIVCTIGPATDSLDQVQLLVDAGMDVARLNLSHGDYPVHETVYDNVRAAAAAAQRGVAILADLQGPKIRLGRFENGPVCLEAGQEFTITTDDILGDERRASTTYKGLPGDARVGDQLLIDDGKVALRITAVSETDVVTSVEVAGPISNNKGINLPGVAVSVPAMSEKDERDLRWALQLGVDLVALSFVRTGRDYEDVRKVMEEEGRIVPVLAKVEKPQAVENLAEIVRAFDGIMVARGDLGVELPLEEVPLVQKRAIDLARRNAKPVIVATQVLESMITNARPTRAEASDCANAVLDGADAVMLSGETSVGEYPIDAVHTMARIIESTEEHGRDRMAPLGTLPHTRGGILTRAAAEIGDVLRAKFLVTFTQSGDSARRMSRLRSPIPLLALTPVPAVERELALSWGVRAFHTGTARHTDEMVELADRLLQDENLGNLGDVVVIVSGAPVGISGTTNSILVHRIGELQGVVAE